MIANYHTHTWRCRHARGTEMEYVQVAKAAGLKTLGFSDHTPYWFGCDYYSNYRMFPEQLGDYVNCVEEARRQNQGELEIRLGVETEYYPKFFGELMARLRDTPIEYMLLGQHYVGDEIGDWYSGRPTADTDILARYCRQVCDAMETGLFSYLAHPGLIHYKGSDTVYRAYLRQVCRVAKSCGLPLEINLLGLRERRHYPDLRVWELAAEEGCTVVFGCDAHDPVGLNDPESLDRAMGIVRNFDLELVETVALRPIG